jgi:hypothetical protein
MIAKLVPATLVGPPTKSPGGAPIASARPQGSNGGSPACAETGGHGRRDTRPSTALEVTTDYLLGRVDDPALAEAGDPLYSDIGKLTEGDGHGSVQRTPDRIAGSARLAAEIDIMDWLGGTRSVAATEEVIGLGRYGKTLTALACPSIRDETCDEDEDSEEHLIRRWTPRFR